MTPCDKARGGCGGCSVIAHPVWIIGHTLGCDGETCDRTCAVPMHIGDETERCTRCETMPWLPCYPNLGRNLYTAVDGLCHAEPDEVHSVCGGLGRFKPDRDTVMRWCRTHDSVMDDDDDTAAMLEACQKVVMEHLLCVVNLGPCDVVWIERPVPLKELGR